ncbi:MAG: response regulator transcription factor [Planctomycetia bacterium]|nr:response regulator transcription factor [Planctomycetia bacterium]
MRVGLAARISPQPDMEICGEAASVDEALAQVKATSPDLCIIDMQLVDSHGIDLIKAIHTRFPSTKMLVVSAFDESLYAERALRAGAHGYINKRELQDNILAALRTVIDGQRYLSPKTTQQLVAQLIGSKDSIDADPIQRLSDRELEIFQLIGHGTTTGAIARQLHLSPHTIDTHREKIKHKLNLKNAAELQRAATQWMLENG